jgi:serine/threonine protein kinase
MGEGYRARDAQLDRDVAIKVLPERLADTAEPLARFEREFRALAALPHANLVTTFLSSYRPCLLNHLTLPVGSPGAALRSR